jgi:hypothetical protein
MQGIKDYSCTPSQSQSSVEKEYPIVKKVYALHSGKFGAVHARPQVHAGPDSNADNRGRVGIAHHLNWKF